MTEDSGVAPAATMSALIGEVQAPKGAAEVDVMGAPNAYKQGRDAIITPFSLL
jgi:hypothetical protein